VSEERYEQRGGYNEKPGSEGANVAVDAAGAPSGSQDTRDLSVQQQQQEGVSPEELDAREERFTGPRKPMGPTEERADDVPETRPAEAPPERRY